MRTPICDVAQTLTSAARELISALFPQSTAQSLLHSSYGDVRRTRCRTLTLPRATGHAATAGFCHTVHHTPNSSPQALARPIAHASGRARLDDGRSPISPVTLVLNSVHFRLRRAPLSPGPDPCDQRILRRRRGRPALGPRFAPPPTRRRRPHRSQSRPRPPRAARKTTLRHSDRRYPGQPRPRLGRRRHAL